MKLKNNISTCNFKKRISLYTSFVFILAVFITTVSVSLDLYANSNQQNLTVSVKIKEFMMLEVSTPSQKIMDSGRFGAQVTTVVRMEDNPVQIRAVLCVPHNQVVQLRVQAHGDMIDSRGNTFPISNVGWKASGQGFRNGLLSKESPQIMAAWIGPGMFQGTVSYYFLKTPDRYENYSQTVTYSLVIP